MPIRQHDTESLDRMLNLMGSGYADPPDFKPPTTTQGYFAWLPFMYDEDGEWYPLRLRFWVTGLGLAMRLDAFCETRMGRWHRSHSPSSSASEFGSAKREGKTDGFLERQ